MSYKLSTTSERRLQTCHKDLQLIVHAAIKVSPIDFGVAEGQRSDEKQREFYLKGLSKLDGVTKKSKHQVKPLSEALDFYPYVNGHTDYSIPNCTAVAMVLITVAEMLYQQGMIKHRLRWGGNWDQDGVILTDQSFDDLPHVELIK